MSVNSISSDIMSWKPVINKKFKPLYITIANQLEQDILKGILVPGTKLPPQRELANYLNVNLSTISKALKVSESKGLLTTAIGSGTFVSYEALSNVYFLSENDGPKMIDMGKVVSDISSNEQLTEQLKSMLKEPNLIKQFNDNVPNGLQWHKDAAVLFMKKAGFSTTPHTIHFAHGGQNAITAILLGLCKPGDKLGTDPHTYLGLKNVATMLGIQLIPIKWENGAISEEELLKACQNDNIKGVYITPDYQNPTTSNMSSVRKKAIAQIAKQYNLFVIEDATYTLLRKSKEKALASYASEQTIYIANLSKSIASGLRLAFMSVPDKFSQQITKVLYSINIAVSPLMLELVSRIIVSNTIENIVDNHQQHIKIRNKIVNQYLGRFHCHGEDHCSFRWLQLPSSITGSEFETLALENGVQIYAAERFVVGDSSPDQAVRLSIMAPKTNEELEEGLKILQQLLNRFT
nr:PLP-dependent aminotransferase family protein [Lysinibacillus timonensis]